MWTFFVIWSVNTVTPWPVVVPTPERLRELVAKLEVPCPPLVTKPYPGHPSLRLFQTSWDLHRELALAGPVAVPPLLALYQDESKPLQARIQAVRILCRHLVGHFHTPDPKVIEAVRSAIRHKDPAMREGVLFELFYVGPTTNRDPGASSPLRTALAPTALKALLPDVIAALADEDAGVVEHAARARATWGQPGVGVRELFAALKRPEPRVRIAAMVALADVGRDDPATFPTFMDAVKHPEQRETYHTAIGYVWRFGPQAKAAVPYLIETLKESENEPSDLGHLRNSAVLCLGRIGADAKPAVAAILKYMQSKGPNRPSGFIGVFFALDRIDPEAAATARTIDQQYQEEFRRWLESKRTPPPIPTPLFPPPIRP
jgi:HEAT repeat protein